jgi:hypothetical protein
LGMILLFHFVLTSLWAYVAHYSYYYTSRLPNGWSQLSAYTLGTLALFPPIVIMHNDLRALKRDPLLRLTVAHALAYLAFGLGTVVGWHYKYYPGPGHNRRAGDNPGD